MHFTTLIIYTHVKHYCDIPCKHNTISPAVKEKVVAADMEYFLQLLPHSLKTPNGREHCETLVSYTASAEGCLGNKSLPGLPVPHNLKHIWTMLTCKIKAF